MTQQAQIIICSHVNSSRLPRKALRLLNGVSAIERIVKRCVPTGYPVTIAVPVGQSSHYAHLRDKYGVSLFEGSADSPLHRMAFCLDPAIPYVVRVTHDDVFVDAETMREQVALAAREQAGYVITPTIMRGADCEVIATENVIAAATAARMSVEHVSYFVRGERAPNPKVVLMRPRESIERPYSLTMDYPEDEAVIQAILRLTAADDDSADAVCAVLDRDAFLLNLNRRPSVTLYTCARNASATVRETVESVARAIRQSGFSVEYIFVDDCSTDATLHAAMMSAPEGTRFVCNEANMGLASSSNLAVSMARGKYVMRVDADDVVRADILNELVGTMRVAKDVPAVVYPDFECRDGDVVSVGAGEFHHAGCALFSRAVLNEIRFTDGLRHWDSLDIYNRIKRYGVAYYTDGPLWTYRKRPGSMSDSEPGRRALLKDMLMDGAEANQ